MKYILNSILFLFVMTLWSCSEDVQDDAYYTLTGKTVASYAESTEGFSTFSKLLKDTKTEVLLSSYGHYTCFMPTDAAFEEFFAQQGRTYDSYTLEEKKSIVYDHIIKSDQFDYDSSLFEEGSLNEPSMNDDYITISYKTDATGAGLTILVNKTTPIIEKDINVHNGVIHSIGGVINPSSDYILNILQDAGTYTIFTKAFEMTHLNDSTERIFDETYVCPSPTGEIIRDGSHYRVPLVKKYGYTLFAEPDEVFNAAGISSVDDLYNYAKRYYTDDEPGDFTKRGNALNKFVSYHLLDRQMSTNSFLYNGPCTAPNFMRNRCEYYETMLKYRLMEIKAGNMINTQKDGTCVELDETRSNLSAVNGFVHCLSSILVYDEDVMTNDVLNKRLRFDFYNIPPELTNNNIRWNCGGTWGVNIYTIPHDFCSKHLSFSKETQITMWAANDWTNFEADELKLNGWYDFTLRMLPVPPGSYEVRIGYRQEDWRGIAQLFVDNEIQGIPRDLRIEGADPQVGWVQDTGGPSDAENDKSMHNRGYMKAPASIYSAQIPGVLRDSPKALRIVLGQFTWQEYGAHYLRGKNVYAPSQEFHGDYIEIIPTSLLDSEDIY